VSERVNLRQGDVNLKQGVIRTIGPRSAVIA
jgi:hypothetical protein